MPAPLGSAHRMSAPYQAVRCADGYITLGAANDRLFSRLCDALDHPEWAAEPDYASDTARVAHRESLSARIEAVTVEHPRAFWLDRLEARDIPCGPINDYQEVMRDPQVRARDMVVQTDHPTLGTISTLGTPLKLSETPLTPGRPAPLLGQHTDEVLYDAGYTIDEIATLKAADAAR